MSLRFCHTSPAGNGTVVGENKNSACLSASAQIAIKRSPSRPVYDGDVRQLQGGTTETLLQRPAVPREWCTARKLWGALLQSNRRGRLSLRLAVAPWHVFVFPRLSFVICSRAVATRRRGGAPTRLVGGK